MRERDNSLKGKALYLLRNQSRGKGLGFYETNGFFPDFILWVVHGEHQRVIFVEPHGLRNEAQGSDKITGFHERLQTYVKKGLHSSGRDNVSVDGWIVSATLQSVLIEQWAQEWNGSKFRDKHILFPHDGYEHVLSTILGEGA